MSETGVCGKIEVSHVMTFFTGVSHRRFRAPNTHFRNSKSTTTAGCTDCFDGRFSFPPLATSNNGRWCGTDAQTTDSFFAHSDPRRFEDLRTVTCNLWPRRIYLRIATELANASKSNNILYASMQPRLRGKCGIQKYAENITEVSSAILRRNTADSDNKIWRPK